jgi:hypothetical protein
VPRISNIDAGLKKEIKLSAASWFKQLTPFFEGGTYLLAGDPGIGKNNPRSPDCNGHSFVRQKGSLSFK